MSIGGKAMETAAKIDAFSKPKSKKNTSKDTSDWRFSRR